jgi:hypothetical protein
VESTRVVEVGAGQLVNLRPGNDSRGVAFIVEVYRESTRAADDIGAD